MTINETLYRSHRFRYQSKWKRAMNNLTHRIPYTACEQKNTHSES